MTQDKFTEQISSWLDGELSPAEVTELQTHLSRCATCQHTYQQFQAMDHWLRNAAAVMAMPAAGFSERFEARLAAYRPPQLWQLLLAVGALVIGAVFVLGGWAIAGGLTLVSVSTTVFNTSLLSQSLISFIESTDSLRFTAEMGLLVIRSSIITMQQPAFWGFMALAVVLALVWVWLLRQLMQRGAITANLLLS